MKTSNKILLIMLIVLFSLVAGLVITARILVSCEPWADEAGSTEFDESDLQSMNYDYQDFSEIRIEGSWQLRIYRADTFGVEVRVPEYLKDEVEVESRDGRLYLKSDRDRMSHDGVRAMIYMPSLSRIESRSGASIKFDDFVSHDLYLQMEGGSSITGRENTIENLYLSSTGATNVDLKLSDVVNADIDLTGASSIILTMKGGELTGSASGASSIRYFGEVSKESIRTSGVVHIQRD